MSGTGGHNDDLERHTQRNATSPGADLPLAVVDALERHGFSAHDEVGLRRLLETRLPGYTLYRLLPAARRRWKSQYRIMFGDTYFDCQTVSEAYARALLATIEPHGNAR